MGLVRPERRNIGLLLVDGTDIVGAPDGIAVVRVKPKATRLAVAHHVSIWVQAVRATISAWEAIGSPEDRFPVVNSPSFGLVELTPGSEIDSDDE